MYTFFSKYESTPTVLLETTVAFLILINDCYTNRFAVRKPVDGLQILVPLMFQKTSLEHAEATFEPRGNDSRWRSVQVL